MMIAKMATETTPAKPNVRLSLRDPAGFLVPSGERMLRTVRWEYANDTCAFLQSSLAREWIQREALIPTEILDSRPGCDAHLAHPRIYFPSYPWEWTPGQLAAAGELTLDLLSDLLERGWVLKDATPLNVLFDGPRPIFIDVLSIERRDPENALWLAYGQFVRTFLLPLAAYKYLGWALSASLTRRDGYNPGDLLPVLGPIKLLREPLRSLVTLPYLLERRTQTKRSTKVRCSPPVALAVLKRTLRSLRRSLEKVRVREPRSQWTRYEETASHYTDEDWARKINFVRECLLICQPRTALDIGGNTGTFSQLAALAGARVVSWDTDVAATEKAWHEARRTMSDITSLVADFARPTPAAGWNNSETLSLLDRSRECFDLVMMLAVLHHLLVADQIPLECTAELVRGLCCRWLLVEWVPPSDPKFQELSCGRDRLYAHLNEGKFLAAFSRHFRPVRRLEVGNGRVLHLLETR